MLRSPAPGPVFTGSGVRLSPALSLETASRTGKEDSQAVGPKICAIGRSTTQVGLASARGRTEKPGISQFQHGGIAGSAVAVPQATDGAHTASMV